MVSGALDHDEEMGSMHEMYGTLQAELEVQRTIKKAELTVFLRFLRKAIGLTMVHADNKGIVGGLSTGATRCIGPRAKDADLRGSGFGKDCKEVFLEAHW